MTKVCRPQNIRARFPAGNAWPAEMRADMAAAYIDYETTGQLWKAIQRGEAPPPSATRVFSGRSVPVWLRAEIEAFMLSRHNVASAVQANNNDASFDAARYV